MPFGRALHCFAQQGNKNKLYSHLTALLFLIPLQFSNAAAAVTANPRAGGDTFLLIDKLTSNNNNDDDNKVAVSGGRSVAERTELSEGARR